MKNKKNWKFFKNIDLVLILLSFLLNFFILFICFCVVIKHDFINVLSYYVLALLSFNNGVIIGDYMKICNIKTRSDFVGYSKLWSKYINDEE